MAETLTKLAPGGQEARGLGVADDRRPNGTLSLARLLVFVADVNLSPAADPQPGTGDVEPINAQRFARRHTDARFGDEGPQTFGHDRRNLRDQIARSAREHSVTPACYPLRTEHCRLQLIRSEHQRWHIEVAIEKVAYSGLATDWYSLPNEVSNVSVNRALGHFQLRG